MADNEFPPAPPTDTEEWLEQLRRWTTFARTMRPDNEEFKGIERVLSEADATRLRARMAYDRRMRELGDLLLKSQPEIGVITFPSRFEWDSDRVVKDNPKLRPVRYATILRALQYLTIAVTTPTKIDTADLRAAARQLFTQKILSFDPYPRIGGPAELGRDGSRAIDLDEKDALYYYLRWFVMNDMEFIAQSNMATPERVLRLRNEFTDYAASRNGTAAEVFTALNEIDIAERALRLALPARATLETIADQLRAAAVGTNVRTDLFDAAGALRLLLLRRPFATRNERIDEFTNTWIVDHFGTDLAELTLSKKARKRQRTARQSRVAMVEAQRLEAEDTATLARRIWDTFIEFITPPDDARASTPTTT